MYFWEMRVNAVFSQIEKKKSLLMIQQYITVKDTECNFVKENRQNPQFSIFTCISGKCGLVFLYFYDCK